MRRVFLVLGVAILVGAAVAFSGSQAPPASVPEFQFDKQARNPVSHFRWNLEPSDFQFAVVSDRTGSHRANIFSQAVHKLNLLQPEFVMSVGDLIEGGTNVKKLGTEWKEFDSFTGKLTMPFFYVSGNHDVATAESSKFWEDKLGKRNYHFVYRQVLFLILNSDDPPGSKGGIGKEQSAWAKQVLQENQGVAWTLVFVHRPLWTGNIAKNGWQPVEEALGGRRYTVFCGHVHRYQKFVRNGQNYYQLATTGGGSQLRGTEQGEFDHVTWVTMKKDGPILANLLLDAIHSENLQKVATNESGNTGAKRKPTNPVRGQAFFEGVPIPGALVSFQPGKDGVKATGIVAADGSFELTTYVKNDGAVAGDYTVTVVWQPKNAQGKATPNRLPARYAAPATSGLTATIQPGKNNVTLELK